MFKSNVKVGRGVIVRRSNVGSFAPVAKSGGVKFSAAAAEVARLRDEANKAEAARAAARYRESLIAKGVLAPS